VPGTYHYVTEETRDEMREAVDRCAQCRAEIAQPERGRRRRYCSRACQARAYRARKRTRPAVRLDRPAALTPARITAAAIALADADGLAELTMRRLATALGTATMSLYRHFPSREALVHAMTDTVAGELEPGDPALGWRDRLAHEAREEWRLYRRHPWVLQVLATTRPPLGPNTLGNVERALQATVAAGLAPDAAMTVYLASSGIVQGMALLPASETEVADRTGETIDEWWEAQAARLTELLDPADFPLLAGQPAGGVFHDFDAVFEFALDAVLTGVQARLDLREV
jgi:AcrR family transcriptional regulator